MNLNDFEKSFNVTGKTFKKLLHSTKIVNKPSLKNKYNYFVFCLVSCYV